jgi:hypothetical protein
VLGRETWGGGGGGGGGGHSDVSQFLNLSCGSNPV